MSASNIFLGIAGSLGGWIVIVAHGLILAVIPRVPCDVGEPDPWRGTLVMGALGLLSAVLVSTGLPWRRGLRWFALAAVPLLAMGFRVVLPYLEVVTAATHPCTIQSGVVTDVPADGWQRAWPLLQMAFLLVASAQVVRYWWPGPKATPQS